MTALICLTGSGDVRRWGFLLLFFVLSVGGCASHSQALLKVKAQLVAQQPEVALATLEELGDDDLPYLLDRAMLLRMSGRYADSNRVFEQGKQLADSLAALSLREQAGALVINDTVRAYSGEAFELVLLHLYEALNYLQLGQFDEARVEALQVNLRLAALADDEEDLSERQRYRDDALAHYLAAVVFEVTADWSDALIAYRRAYDVYRQYQKLFAVPPPLSLKLALLRLTQYMGLTEELRRYQQRFAIQHWPSQREYRAQADLLFLLHNGLVPAKQESFVYHFSPEAKQMVRIALPYYEKTRPAIAFARLRIPGFAAVKSEVVEDIGAIARQTLAENLPVILVRAMARAVIKWKAAHELGKEQGDMAALVANIAGLVTERADTRNWLTLPEQIQMARLLLPAGEYDLTIELLDRQGGIVHSETRAVVMTAGRPLFLEMYWASQSVTDSGGR